LIANIAAVLRRKTARQKRPSVHLLGLNDERPETKSSIGGLSGPFVGGVLTVQFFGEIAVKLPLLWVSQPFGCDTSVVMSV
jgi:hypothetical protein